MPKPLICEKIIRCIQKYERKYRRIRIREKIKWHSNQKDLQTGDRQAREAGKRKSVQESPQPEEWLRKKSSMNMSVNTEAHPEKKLL